MEKWLVVTGIWMMLASCMVLFIRGATRPSSSELLPVEVHVDERERKRQEPFRI